MKADKIRLLLLEESKEEVEIIHTLLKSELSVPVKLDTADRIDLFQEMFEKGRYKYDVIIANDELLINNASNALEYILKTDPEKPVILIIRNYSDIKARELIRSGAYDIVIRDKLIKLPFAVYKAREQTERTKIARQTEIKLKNLIASYDEAQKIAKLGNWEWTRTGNLVYWSDEMFRLLDLEPGEVLPSIRAFLRYIHAGDRKRVITAMSVTLNSGVEFDEELKIISKDGKSKIIHCLAKPYLNAKGKTESLTGIIQDITEAKKVEYELMSVKEKLEEAQRISHLGTCEYNSSDESLKWSDETYNIFGYDKRTTKLRPRFEFEHIIESEKEKIINDLTAAANEKRPYDSEFWIVRPDGEKRYIHYLGMEKTDPLTGNRNILATVQDLTSRKLTEESLKSYSKFQDTILNLSKGFIKTPFNQIDKAIDLALSYISDLYGYFHSSVWRINYQTQKIECVYMWNKDPNVISDNNWNELDFNQIEGLIDLNNFDKPVFKSLSDVKSENIKLSINNICINSLFIFPLVNEGMTIGGVVFGSRSKTNEVDGNISISGQLLCSLISSILSRKEQEVKLSELNENYRLILESVEEGIVMFKRDGTFINVNKHFAVLFSLSAQECIGKNIKSLLHNDAFGDLYIRIMEKIEQVYDTGKPVVYDDIRDGFWHVDYFYPVITDGRVRAVTMITRDITDIKKAEETSKKLDELNKEAQMLREKEAEYLQMLDGSTEATWIYDYEKKTLKFSHDWKKRIGGEEISDEDMIKFQKALIHPEDIERVKLERCEFTHNKKNKFCCEYRILTADGDYIWVQDKGKISYTADGKPGKIYGTSIEVTDRVSAISKLNAIRDDLALEVEALKTIHSLNSNYFVQDGLQTLYNKVLSAAAALTSTDKGLIQVIDEQKRKLRIAHSLGIETDFIDFVQGLDLRSSVCGQVYMEKRRIILKDVYKSNLCSDDTARNYFITESIKSLQSTPLISSSGKFFGTLCTCYKDEKRFVDRELRMLDMLARMAADMIERTETEMSLHESEQHALKLVEELKKEDRNKNEFLGILSHELRNPLATIDAALNLLYISKDLSESEKIKEIIQRQLSNLRKLVEDLLDLTRISRNRIIPHKEKMDINITASRVVEDIRHQYDEKGIELNLFIEEYPIYLNADPLRISQIIENLLFNALKFTDTGGKVNITVAREDDNVVMYIKDNGAGIDSAVLPDIFNAFSQADNSLDRTKGGLGLGLTIVKNIVQLHGGTVSAFSEGIGKGSLFTIRLPIYDSNESSALPLPDKTQALENPIPSLKIMLIEDNKDLAQIQCALLEKMGQKVTVAFDGPEGIGKSRDIVPDIVLCDIGLPGMSGFDVALSLRSDPRLKNVYLAALSGYASESDRQNSLKCGFDLHLVKPVDNKTLENIILSVSSERASRI